MADFKALARAAAVEAHGDSAVGDFIDVVEEPDAGVFTYLFASKLKGYPDWRVSVTLFQDGESATVSELLIVPGPESLTAPAWVPWSERLADYKALQAALEAEAAAAAELAEDADEDQDEEAEDDEVEGSSEESADQDEDNQDSESAVADVPETVESQEDANDTGGKGKGFFKWKTLRGGKKRK
jgi:hypothetical protein